MRDVLLFIAMVAAFYSGFACLALSQHRHWRLVVRHAEPRRGVVVGLRFSGGMMLILGLAAALVRDGPSFGSVLAIVLSGAAAIGVALTLAWSPASLRWIGTLASR